MELPPPCSGTAIQLDDQHRTDVLAEELDAPSEVKVEEGST